MTSDLSVALQQVVDMAIQGARSEHVGHAKRAFIIPDGYALEIKDFAKDEKGPQRPAGTAVMREIDSLIDFVRIHQQAGTAIYIDDLRVTAVINGHIGQDSEAGWGDFVAIFEPKYTPGWTAWNAWNGKWVEQRQFAELLEDRIPEIAHPDGARVLEAVTNLRVKYQVNFERVIETTNDLVQLVYKEESEAGSIAVPTKLDLYLPMFEGGESYMLGVKLRSTKPNQNGQVQFRVDLGEELHTIVREARKDIRDKLRTSIPEVPVFIGQWHQG